jgi:hypothetical protein
VKAPPPPTSWAPLTPRQVTGVLAPLGVRWWIAGGLAIDLAAGHKTRVHGDIDVAMLRSDARALSPLRDAWDIRIAHDGTLLPWDGGDLAEEHHQFWIRRANAAAWQLEVLFEHHDGGEWIYRRDARIRTPLAQIDAVTVDELPYLRPEIVLLYKSNRPELERNARDFDVALSLLGPQTRSWLATAIEMIDEGHPWIARLRQP